MLDIIKKAAALKMLEERTGRKFSKGIFSEHFRRGRIWAAGGTVFVSDVEKFIEARQARMDEPAERKIDRRIMALVRACCAHDTTMENLLKLVADQPEAAKQIERARGWNSWTVQCLMNARRLPEEKAVAPVSPPANPNAGGDTRATSGEAQGA
jgi:hypothetical protein